MIKRDYRYTSENKIRNIYIRLLSKHSGTKHYTITHSSFKKEIVDNIKADLKTYLQLSEEQSDWLFNSHTKKSYHLKDELLNLDYRINDKQEYYMHDFVSRTLLNAYVGIALFSIILLVPFFLVISMVSGFGDIDDVGIGVSATLMLFAFAGYLLIYYKYQSLFLLKKELGKDEVYSYNGKIESIKLKDHLQYFGYHGSVISTNFGVSIVVLVNNKKVKLVYPFLDRDVRISDSILKIRKRRKKVWNELQKIDSINVKYYPKSRVISSPIQAIDKIAKQSRSEEIYGSKNS